VLAFVGRLQPLKAPDVAVRVLGELRRAERPLDVELLVVGGPSGNGGMEPERLRALAVAEGVADRVSFLPALSQERLADVFRAADLTLVPSHSEAFGLVALESQACGTPVVAARVGGLQHAVGENTTGRLVPGHDPADHAAAVAALLGNPRRLAAMSVAAARFAQAHGWSVTADRLLDVYAELQPAALLTAALERTS
jgi:D-inositol-3-phosphate glycosyltransferase